MTERYTEQLIKKGEERKRLTDQLATLVVEVADSIASSVEVGTEAHVAKEGQWGRYYKVIERSSNVGTVRYLSVEINNDDYGDTYYTIFDNQTKPGGSYYLHGDFNCSIAVAPRDEFLLFANNLPEIVRAFEAKEEEVISSLRSAFEKLQKLAK